MIFAVLAQGASPGASGILGFLPFILIMVVVYFLMLRPQMKKQKEHAKMAAELRKGDDIVTSGGIHGRVVAAVEKESTIKVDIARGIIVTVERGSVARKISAGPELNTEPKSQEPKQQKTDGGQIKKEIWGESQSSGVVTSTGRTSFGNGDGANDSSGRGSSGRRDRHRRFRHRRPHHGPGRESTPGGETPPTAAN